MFDDEEEDKPSPQDEALSAKAKDLYKVVMALSKDVPEENIILKEQMEFMFQDAALIRAKIAGASGKSMYDIKMQNAALIRKAAMDLMTSIHMLHIHGYNKIDYFKVFRQTIEEFRLIFLDWVEHFDQTDYITDRWGLFNPPGVSARDVDDETGKPYNSADLDWDKMRNDEDDIF